MEAVLAGYVWLPRMIDKARAARAGTLGDMLHPCPVDQACLARLGLGAATFGDVVHRHESDEDVLAALQRIGIPSARDAWFDAIALEESLQGAE